MERREHFKKGPAQEFAVMSVGARGDLLGEPLNFRFWSAG